MKDASKDCCFCELRVCVGVDGSGNSRLHGKAKTGSSDE